MIGLQTAELDLLSNIDPNDEFLQSTKSFSLIEGVSLNESEYSILSAQSSEYSVISGSKIHSLLKSVISLKSEGLEESKVGVTISLDSLALDPDEKTNSVIRDYLHSSRFSEIDTYRDTYAEDIVMQKVIYYISLF